jgi:hypothetical protein
MFSGSGVGGGVGKRYQLKSVWFQFKVIKMPAGRKVFKIEF